VILGEVASTSEVVCQHQHRIKTLEKSLLITKCEMLEEKEGRINSDASHHIIVKGKKIPFFERGEDLQAKLKAQVNIKGLNGLLTSYPCPTLLFS